jgi:predicted nicotinamide N-methyase
VAEGWWVWRSTYRLTHVCNPFWDDLPEALRTERAQNESKNGAKAGFEELYREPEGLSNLWSDGRISAGNFTALVEKFDFSKYKTLCDVGGAAATLSMIVAQKYPNLEIVSADLPQASAIAAKKIEAAELSDRVGTKNIDFFKDELPKADVITMGMILHDWNLENKMMLIRKAYDALPEGGAFIVIEALIDDARRENAFGLMMSLNMIIEFGEAFDYSGADFDCWCKEVGFKRTEVIHLAGPASAGVAYK